MQKPHYIKLTILQDSLEVEPNTTVLHAKKSKLIICVSRHQNVIIFLILYNLKAIMNPSSRSLLENTFKKYYFDNFDLLHVPSNPHEREFAYKKFDSKLYRHISLKSDKELHLLLMTQTPL